MSFLIDPYQFNTFTNLLSTEFDGVNERVSFGAASGLIGASEFSMGMWIKLLAFPAANQIIWADSLGRLSLQASDAAGTGNIRFFHFGGGNSNIVNVPLNTWTRLDLTKKTGSQSLLYKNAVSGAGANGVNTDTLAGTFTLGGIATAGFSTNIRVNMFEVYNLYLTQANVTERYNGGVPTNALASSFAANLTHYYRMGNGDTFPTITDRKGSVNGTMTNMESGDFVTDAP